MRGRIVWGGHSCPPGFDCVGQPTPAARSSTTPLKPKEGLNGAPKTSIRRW